MGVMDWEFGISRCKLLYTEWINNRVLLCNTENHIHILRYTIMKNMKNNVYTCAYICIYIYISTYVCTTESLCCAVEINTTLHCKSLYFNKVN